MIIHNPSMRRLSGLLALVGVLALAAGPAEAVCSRTWVGGVDSNFGTAGNWSPGTVPGSSDDACITTTTTTIPPAVADTYSVILNGSFSVHSLTLGGPNGTQTLVLPAANLAFSLGAASAVTANGVLTLGDGSGGFSVLAGPGSLTNSGHVNTIAGGGGIRYLRTNISNAAAGTIDIGTTTNQDQGGTLTNNGTVTVEATGSLSLTSGSSFANNGGAVTNNGAFGVSGGTFTQRGGTESGHAVLLSGSTLDDDLGAGAGLFSFTGNGTLTGSGSKPGVAPGQVVTIASNNNGTTLTKDLTNAGTITLGDSNGGFSVLRGPGLLTNSAQLNTIVGGGGLRYLRLNITNSSDGTVDIIADTRQDAGDVGATTFINNGMVTVEAVGGLSLSSGSSFVNNGGAVINSGAFSVSGGGTFTQRGGSESGNAVLLSGSTLDDDLGAGAGLFSFTGNGTLTGSGSSPGVATSQVVSLSASNISVALAVNLTNAGTITLGDSNGGFSVLQGPGVLTNSGQLNTIVGGGGIRYFRLNISNAAGGTVDVGASDTRQDSGTLTTNNGTVMVEAAGNLSLSSGSSFANTAGTVTNNGGFSVSSGKFTQRGGSESGNAVLLSSSTLDDDLEAGAGLFRFTGNGTLTGSGSKPGVAAGQVVTVSAANISAAVAVNLTNAGTITLGDSGGAFSVLAGPGALTNSGQLNTVQGVGGIRYFRLNITNAAGGTIDVGASDTRQDSGTLTTNNGTVMIQAGRSLSLRSGSSFAQGASATFATTLDANTTTFGQLTGGGGSVGLDGKLRVTTVGSPMIGSSWPIISGANRSGQFAALDFGSYNYDVQYPSAGVTLVTLSTPTPTSPTPTPTATSTTATTPTSRTTPTATRTNTGAPTATVTVTVAQTRTATPTASVAPSATATQTPTATGTQASSATATASMTSTDTPTATTTPSPTGTPTLSVGMVVLAGRVLSPGRGGLVTDHGQVAFGDAAVDLFLCEVRKPCLPTGQPVASTVTDPDGRFRIQVSADLIQGTLPVVLARIAPTFVLRAPVLVIPVSQAAAAAHARQVADDTDTVVDSISEAAVRLLENVGFENFSVTGVGSVVQAVKAANATANFENLTAEQAVDQAQGTAASDPAVQMALSAGGCVGDCNGRGEVTVDEIIKGVNIALGNAGLDTCPRFDADGSGDVTINELIVAVNNALAGCPAS